MRHARVIALAGLAVVATAAVAYAAQTTVVPVPDNAPVEAAPLEVDLSKTHWGDAEAGAEKAVACAACHGADGNPTDPQYPRLAGQSERYMARQLALFASGERHGGLAAVMAPFAQMLSPQDMRDVGAFFATQKAGAGVADDALVEGDGPYAGLKFYEIGQKLYRGGDPERGIPACLACHGPAGAGNPGPAYPHVGGQMADYTARRLQEYQAGVTSEKDPTLFHIMAQVAGKLTEQEIGALSSYLQGLHDRADDVAEAGIPPRS
ncbi:cytochrome C [Pseudoxanthomonas broegbernensis]|uniref:Cytochrome C n=1 Tax=Pseudoxanthomonas broegbernensis TaxID=83619 RepID=A0A7V8GNI7_9GAMM|nr:c-type cytochrome [Pseudoxanthomonas broegbernensis]KAF1687143.1 cytochrome C [Pseudoxanthomonas broegbernensis]MBB6065880.1 cytochrome c553 [Pseudoxanthomonas broegbernensis]